MYGSQWEDSEHTPSGDAGRAAHGVGVVGPGLMDTRILISYLLRGGNAYPESGQKIDLLYFDG